MQRSERRKRDGGDGADGNGGGGDTAADAQRDTPGQEPVTVAERVTLDPAVYLLVTAFKTLDGEAELAAAAATTAAAAATTRRGGGGGGGGSDDAGVSKGIFDALTRLWATIEKFTKIGTGRRGDV